MAATQNQQPRSPEADRGAGNLIIVIIAALAVIIALVISGMRLFGNDGTAAPGTAATEQQTEAETGKYPTELWNQTKKLDSYALNEGTLVTVTNGTYTPNSTELQLLSEKGNGEYTLGEGIGMKLNRVALAHLNSMTYDMNHAIQFNESLSVHTAYSTAALADYQTALTVRFRLTRGGISYSLSEATGSGDPVEWLTQNAWKYGYILRYPAGATATGQDKGVPDVYRYVGVPHAYYITKIMKQTEGVPPCLEDYLTLVRAASAKQPVEFEVTGSLNGADDGTYNVYYVAAANAATAQIRTGATLADVSGDNEAGYIVTVKVPATTGA